MPWMRLQFAPGVVRDSTRYSGTGTWFDSNLVRFREGKPERWGGWVKSPDNFTFLGICRSLNRFSDLSGLQWTGVGTSRRFYVVSDDVNYDVTPLRATQALGVNPISTVNTSPVITIAATSHGAQTGDYVIIRNAASTGGITHTAINDEHQITYINDNSFSINPGINATSTTSGGGITIELDWLFRAGSDDQSYGGGWGTLSWSEEEWGGGASAGLNDRLGIWSQDNWGEDMIANAQAGPIFYWDATNPSDRMIDILDLPSADGHAPTASDFILVSHRDRHLLSFGPGSTYGGGPASPMTVRWCDQEDILNWNEADTAGTAGSLPLSSGSRLISAIQTTNEILVWSDAALYSMQYIGAPLIYGANIIEPRSDIVGLKACNQYSGSVYWMGRSGFYRYTGRVEMLPCPVWDYISRRMVWEQSTKIHCSVNGLNGEIIWFYPAEVEYSESPNSGAPQANVEIDSYVSYNPQQDVWTIGSLARTAWLDGNTLNNPLAASTDAYLYAHETGADDGSTNPAGAINAYIESSPFELSSEGAYDKGDRFMFIRRILPDVTFRNTSSLNPQMNITLKMMDKPGGGFHDTSSSQVARSVTIPVEEFTDDVHVRLRGRALVLRAESDTTGSLWRLGTPRVDVRTDGQR